MNIGEMFVRLGLDITDFSKGLTDVQSELDRIGKNFAQTGQTLTLAITAPLVGIAGAALKAFADFESAMNRVQALGGMTADQMQKLNDQAMELGKLTQYSAKQAADAMGDLAQAGFKANEIMSAMPGVLALASTENMKIADAASIAAGVLKGFGLSASSIGQVADLLAQTAASSASSVQSLGYAFQYVGPVAKAAGMSMLDVSAALGVLSNAGIKGESAGTGIRNLLSDLSKVTPKAALVMQGLGINVMDAANRLKPMEQIIKELLPLTDNISAGFTIFGQRFSDVLPLLQAGGAAFGAMKADITDFNGAAESMRKIMQQGTAAAWENFTSSLETVGIKLGKVLAPLANQIIKFAQGVVDATGPWIDAMSKWPPSMQAAALAVVGFAAVIGPALWVFGSMAGAIGNLKLLTPVVSLIGTGFTKLGLDLTGLSGVMKSAYNTIAGLNFASLFKTAFSGLTTMGETIIASFTKIPGAISAAGSAIVSFGGAISGAVLTGVKSFGAALAAIPGYFSGLVASLTGGAGLSGAIATIGGWFTGLGATITAAIDVAITAVSSVGAAIGAAAIPVAASVAVIAAAVAVLVGIGHEIYKNWDDIKNVLVAVWHDISNAVQTAAAAIWKWISDALGPTVTGWITAAWTKVKDFFVWVWKGITDAFGNATKWLVEMALTAAKALGMSETTVALQNWLDKLNGVKVAAQGAGAAVSGLGAAAANALQLATAAAEKSGAVIGDIMSKALITSLTKDDAAKYGQQVANALKEAVLANTELSKAMKAGTVDKTEATKAQAQLNLVIGQGNDTLKQLGVIIAPAAQGYKEFKDAAKEAGKAQREYESDLKKVADTVDRVQKTFAKLPMSMQEFSQGMDQGTLNFRSALKSVNDEILSIGQTMARETDPAIRSAFQGQINLLTTYKAKIVEWKAAWDVTAQEEALNKLVRDTEASSANINRAIREIQIPDSLKLLADPFHKAEVAATEFIDVLQKGGAEVDEVWVKTSGQFTKLAVEADRAREAYDKMLASGLYTASQLDTQWGVYLERKVKAEQETLDKIKIADVGFMTWFTAQSTASVAEFQLSVRQATKAMSDTLTKDFGTVFHDIFSGQFNNIAADFEKLGKNMLTGIEQIFLKPLTDKFQKFIAALASEITNFVTTKILKLLGGALDGILSKVPMIGNAFQNVFGKGVTSLDKIPDVLKSATDSAKQAAEAAKEVSKAATDAAKMAEEASKASQAAANATKVAAGSVTEASQATTSALSKVTGWINLAANVVTAVFTALQYFQGRRIEQDIGRIEVTSREIKELLSNGDGVIAWLKSMGLASRAWETSTWPTFMNYFAQLMSTGEGIRAGVDRLVDLFQAGLKVTGTGGTSGGSAGSSTTPTTTPSDYESAYKYATIRDSIDALIMGLSSVPATPVDSNYVPPTYGSTIADATDSWASTVATGVAEPLSSYTSATQDASDSIQNAGVMMSGSVLKAADAITTGTADAMENTAGIVATFKNDLDGQIAGLAKLLQPDKNAPVYTDPLWREYLTLLAEKQAALAKASGDIATSAASAMNTGVIIGGPPKGLQNATQDNWYSQWATGVQPLTYSPPNSSPLQFNFYGVTDPAKMADKIVTNLRSRGVDI